MTFRSGAMTYRGISASDIVRQMRQQADGFTGDAAALYPFLLWSLSLLEDRLPFRELELSEAVDEETLALSYLCLLDRYGVGEFPNETGEDASAAKGAEQSCPRESKL